MRNISNYNKFITNDSKSDKINERTSPIPPGNVVGSAISNLEAIARTLPNGVEVDHKSEVYAIIKVKDTEYYLTALPKGDYSLVKVSSDKNLGHFTKEEVQKKLQDLSN